MADLFITRGDSLNPLKSLGGLSNAKINLQSKYSDVFGEESDKLTVRQGYERQGWLRRCVQVRSRAAGSIPYTLSNEQGDPVYDSDEGEPLPEGLEALENLPRFFALASAALALEGKAVALKTMQNGRFTGLQWWNPTTVEPRITRQDGYVGVWRTSNGQRTPYDAEDLVAVWEPSPYAEAAGGKGDGHSARVHADILESMGVWLDEHFDSGLIKATIFATDTKPPPEERERFLDLMKRKIFGKRNHEPIILNGKEVSVHTIGEGLKELANTELTEEQRQAVAAAIGVPYSLMQSSAANYATKQADQLDLYLFTAIPDALLIQDAVNEQLLSEWGLTLTFETKRLEVVQRYELDKATAVKEVVGEPVLTRDEGREILGYKPLGDDAPVPDETPEGETRSVRARQVEEAADLEHAKGHLFRKMAEAARGRELAAWRKCAESRGRAYDFTPEYLTEDEHAVIYARLMEGADLDEAFSPPFRADFP